MLGSAVRWKRAPFIENVVGLVENVTGLVGFIKMDSCFVDKSPFRHMIGHFYEVKGVFRKHFRG